MGDETPRRISHLFGGGSQQAIEADMLQHAAKPTTSHWLRDALQESLRRDALDALNDAETLQEYLEVRFAAIVLAKGG